MKLFFQRGTIERKINALIMGTSVFMLICLLAFAWESHRFGAHLVSVSRRVLSFTQAMDDLLLFQGERMVLLERILSPGLDRIPSSDFNVLRKDFLKFDVKIATSIKKALTHSHELDKLVGSPSNSLEFFLRGIDKENAEFEFHAEKLLNQMRLKISDKITFHRVKKEAQELQSNISNILMSIKQLETESTSQLAGNLKQTHIRLIFFALSFLALVAILSRFITKTIIQNLTYATHISNEISKGNLEVPIDTSVSDETGVLLCSLKEMIQKIKEANKKVKEQQVQLVQTSKLASLGTLSSGVAHELNNPLTAIKGFAQMLERKAEEGSKTQERASHIVVAANRMKKIIEQMRKLAREPTEEDWKMMDINSAINNSVSLLMRRMQVSGIELSLQLKEIPPIYGNEVDLENVFHNLLTNSIDAFDSVPKDRKHKITISTAPVSNKQIEIKHEDNACGMDENTRQRIFDPFFTTKEVGKGAGLGMSVTHEIISKHRGQITVQSTLNQGSVFQVWLPVA